MYYFHVLLICYNEWMFKHIHPMNLKVEHMSRDIHVCGILTSVESEYSDEPMQPLFNLRSSKWCSVSSLTVIEYSMDYQRVWLLMRRLLVAHTTLLEISCRNSYSGGSSTFCKTIRVSVRLDSDQARCYGRTIRSPIASKGYRQTTPADKLD